MNCRDELLHPLLEPHGSDQVPEDVLAHIDVCPRCQQRLVHLAATATEWSDITQALKEPVSWNSSVVVTVDPELTADLPFHFDPVSLHFLDPPAHPELLGKLQRYDVERLIGAGGMGIVLKAFDPELHRPVAIKVLSPHLANSGGARQRFAREAQSAAAVVHENVVPIHNVDSCSEFPFLVMQYVPGESLQARVDRDGPLSEVEILRIGSQVAQGLAAAHRQGLIHRDVKPGNILLNNGTDRAMITDFGLARTVDDASVTRSGVIAGTPHYMSPEQARGSGIDARSDLFGLGSVLYFMCTGDPPFRAEGAMAVLRQICDDPHRPVDETQDHISADLAELIDHLLDKSPERRPVSAEAVSARLNRLLQQPRSARRRRLAHLRRRHFKLACFFLGLLLFISFILIRTPWSWPIAVSMPATLSEVLSGTSSATDPSENDRQTSVTEDPIKPDDGPFLSPFVEADDRFWEELQEVRVTIDSLEAQDQHKTLEIAPPGDPWLNDFESVRRQVEQREEGSPR